MGPPGPPGEVLYAMPEDDVQEQSPQKTRRKRQQQQVSGSGRRGKGRQSEGWMKTGEGMDDLLLWFKSMFDFCSSVR